MFHLLTGVVTMNPVPWELEKNFREFEGFVRQAAARRAELVIGPECVLDGYVCGADPDTTVPRMLDVAQTVPDGPYLQRAARLSEELGIYLVFGFLERQGDELFNACVMLDPKGQVIGWYRKVHPTSEFGITPGRELQTFGTPLGRVGFLLCNDASVAENFSALSAQQAEIIFIPTNGGARTMVDFILRAVDNSCWIVVANTASCGIVSPRGEVYLEKRESQCVSVQRMDLWNCPRKDRPEENVPSFTGRRPDLYQPIASATEPVTLFDAQGRPTPLEEKRRRQWLEQLRRIMDR